MKGNSCTLLLYFIVFSRESVTFHGLVGIGQRKQEGEPMTTSGCDFGMRVKYEIETSLAETHVSAAAAEGNLLQLISS